MNVAKQRRRKIQSTCRHWNRGLPARRAFGDALIHEPLDAFELHAGDDRSDVDGLIEWRGGAQRVHLVLDSSDQPLPHAFPHPQTPTPHATPPPLIPTPPPPTLPRPPRFP